MTPEVRDELAELFRRKSEIEAHLQELTAEEKAELVTIHERLSELMRPQ